ncbi:DUF4349 domain-containing protein [Solitalea canadensis]|uniref:DUF4349 domain-containing protein n=1 Tax=Solitalea canadensis (strain ATCC 29591 / DSM 3403 / JCM 21819 / LMG 8368 / NBRC 15130 / NCIMB 12057 / USAM 9D) TaxID=929556 RepID=H8KUG1_SOLCM|nr:DUF4349 domain-containing protein [Solitalea canadensis]AFD07326.1 hypothetical protein Solca_2284 [Solitalea canadensis DSM 3403]
MPNFKTQFWRISKWFGAVFILLFIFRLIYGYVAGGSVNYNNNYSEDFFSSIENLRKNYASEKILIKGANYQAVPSLSTNQKFEKTASIKTKSSEFEKDDKLIKGKTKSYSAVIQYEQNVGQQGNRQLHLVIGVNPAKFDSFYVDIQKIGLVKTKEITKVDKTNEYRQLNAKKVSIEKTLQSLNELKSRGGEITDFIALNDKILETEEKLQELGVELGNFDSENEFCTVKLSLYEGATEKKIGLFHRVKVSLEWTIKYFAIIVFISLVLSLTIFVLLLIADKLKVMNLLNNK